jgi:sulfite exporter TauE/SafE
MIELPYIFIGGLLGSAHCLGMCGPLAISLSTGASEGCSLLRRQLAFSFGRVFTYCFCGALAGFGGAWVTTQQSSFVISQATLALTAGVVLVLMGLVTAGILPAPIYRIFGGIPCGAGSWLKTFLSAPGLTGPLVAGVFTGFIPCGLVYAFLLKAGSTGAMWQAVLTMMAFGLGTIPMMIAVGYGGQFISGMGRARLYKVAAWCIVVTGLISIARGAIQFQTQAAATTPPCPFCEPTTAAVRGS